MDITYLHLELHHSRVREAEARAAFPSAPRRGGWFRRRATTATPPPAPEVPATEAPELVAADSRFALAAHSGGRASLDRH
jgi:hypothetical protein